MAHHQNSGEAGSHIRLDKTFFQTGGLAFLIMGLLLTALYFFPDLMLLFVEHWEEIKPVK